MDKEIIQLGLQTIFMFFSFIFGLWLGDKSGFMDGWKARIQHEKGEK